MGNIIILDENTSNKIAAGEVIDRPASVVKELLENAIDAGADNISVEIKNGGISLIKVIDNGSGIEEDDVEIAFERHATSKIRGARDLEAISTMGFRGEALASIASVSVVQVSTRTSDNTHGKYIEIKGGVVTDSRQKGCPKGTTFIVKDLFYNTPARYKFLKKDSTEAGYISDMVNRIALGNPNISIRLISNGTTVVHTPGNNDLISTIFSIYGKETAGNLCEVDYEDEKVRITGYVGKAEISRSNRNHQSFFINRRYIKSRLISSAIEEAYKTLLMKNRYAFAVLNIDINSMLVDVNVHPSKLEVKFSNEQDIYRSIYHAVNNALLKGIDYRKIEVEGKGVGGTSLIKEVRQPDTPYIQQSIPTNSREQKSQDFIQEINDTLVDKQILNKEPDTHSESSLTSVEPLISQVEPESASPSEVETVSEVETLSKVEALSELEAMPEHVPVLRHKDDKWSLAEARIIGQAFSTYILMQNGEELILVDQHAAHERIMFEKMKMKYYDNKPLAQMLLTPMVVELTFQEVKFIEENSEFFTKLGFIFEGFGNNSIILRSIPSKESGGPVKELFLEIIDFVMSSNKVDSNIAEDALYSIACKAAVKANKKLGELEMRQLIKELEALENPYTCPHGRPTVIRLTRYELEKMFKRA